jgi:hypothetical protein
VTLTPKQAAFAWAFGSTIGNPHRRLVLVTVALASTDVGALPGHVVCDLPAEQLAVECEMSTSGVRNALRDLAKAELIRIVHRGGLPNRILIRHDQPTVDLTAEGIR